MGTLRKSLATEQVDRVERRTTKNVGEARNRYVERNTPGDENEGIKRATRWAQLKVRYQSKGDRKDHQVCKKGTLANGEKSKEVKKIFFGTTFQKGFIE